MTLNSALGSRRSLPPVSPHLGQSVTSPCALRGPMADSSIASNARWRASWFATASRPIVALREPPWPQRFGGGIAEHLLRELDRVPRFGPAPCEQQGYRVAACTLK